MRHNKKDFPDICELTIRVTQWLIFSPPRCARLPQALIYDTELSLIIVPLSYNYPLCVSLGKPVQH